MPAAPLTAPARVVAALLAVVVAVLLAACGAATPRATATYSGTTPGASAVPTPTSSSASASAEPSASATPRTTPSDAASIAPASPVSDLPTVVVATLPKQAWDTLRLIESGGPFPYSKDGVTFSNREGLLPEHASGWYQEYTVITPGSPDRGARRIIAGKDGGRFYTSDHYDSFREVISGVSS